MPPNTEITIINSNSRSYLHYQQGLLPEEYNGANIAARRQKKEENLGRVSSESLSTSLIEPSFVRTDEAEDRLRDDPYPAAKWKNSQAQNEVARANTSMY